MDTNDIIANLFGTDYQGDVEKTASADVDAETLEKIASIEVIEKIAAERGVDVSGEGLEDMSVEELHSVIAQAIGDDDQEKVAGLDITADQFAEAKQMGEVIAHSAWSTWQQLGDVEKTAGVRWDAVKGATKRAYESTKGAAGTYGRRLANRPSMKDAFEAVTGRGVGEKATKHWKKQVWAARGATAGGAAAAAGGGYALSQRGKKKESSFNPNSAFDQMAFARAQEMAAELEKTAGAEEPGFDDYVNEAALNILRENGYDV